jgi:hypothetical protein
MSQVIPVAKAYVIGNGKDATSSIELGAATLLSNCNTLRLKQGRAVAEAFSCGAVPNIYTIADFNSMYQQQRNGKPWRDPVPLPIFFVEEEGGECCSNDFWCRVCCSPNHPVLLKFYHATPPQPQDSQQLWCIKCGERPDRSYPIKDRGAFLTVERPGLCQKWNGCFACNKCCQDEMRMHAGDVGKVGDAGHLDDATLLAHGMVPKGGGGCTPTVNVMDRSMGEELQEPSFVVEGPTFYGGMVDFCCDTSFKISRTKGKSGDLGRIVKKIPHGCCGDNGYCRAICSTADTYDIILTQDGATSLTPVQKAAVVSEAIHLDYMFFERDGFFLNFEQRGGNQVCTFTLCMCYLYGCTLPCQIVCQSKE